MSPTEREELELLRKLAQAGEIHREELTARERLIMGGLEEKGFVVWLNDAEAFLNDDRNQSADRRRSKIKRTIRFLFGFIVGHLLVIALQRI